MQDSLRNNARRLSPAMGGIALVLVSVVGVLAALHLRQRPQEAGFHPEPAQPPASNPADPGFSLERLPLSLEAQAPALRVLERLPADLEFPPGARALSLIELRQAGLTQTKAEYLCANSSDQVLSFFRQRLGQLGWQESLVHEPASSGASPLRPSGVYHRESQTLTLFLQAEGSGTRAVVVIVAEDGVQDERN